MKKALLVVGLIAMAALVGCKKSEEGGRAGNETFRVVVPALSRPSSRAKLRSFEWLWNEVLGSSSRSNWQ